jgi:hypothetical protein
MALDQLPHGTPTGTPGRPKVFNGILTEFCYKQPESTLWKSEAELRVRMAQEGHHLVDVEWAVNFYIVRTAALSVKLESITVMTPAVETSLETTLLITLCSLIRSIRLPNSHSILNVTIPCALIMEVK